MSQNTNHTNHSNKSKHGANRAPSPAPKTSATSAAGVKVTSHDGAAAKANSSAHAETPPTIKSAIKEVEVGASHLVQAVNAEVQTRTGEAIGTIKEKLTLAEEKVEKLVEQIPGVGPDAAQKLRALTHDEPNAPTAPAAPNRH